MVENGCCGRKVDGWVRCGGDGNREKVVGLSELEIVVEVDLRLSENMMRVGVLCDLCGKM